MNSLGGDAPSNGQVAMRCPLFAETAIGIITIVIGFDASQAADEIRPATKWQAEEYQPRASKFGRLEKVDAMTLNPHHDVINLAITPQDSCVLSHVGCVTTFDLQAPEEACTLDCSDRSASGLRSGPRSGPLWKFALLSERPFPTITMGHELFYWDPDSPRIVSLGTEDVSGISADGRFLVRGRPEKLQWYDRTNRKPIWEGETLGDKVEDAVILDGKGIAVLTGPEDDRGSPLERQPTRVYWIDAAQKRPQRILTSDEFEIFPSGNECAVNVSKLASSSAGDTLFMSGHVYEFLIRRTEGHVLAFDTRGKKFLWSRFFAGYGVTTMEVSRSGRLVVVCLDRESITPKHVPESEIVGPQIVEILDGRTGDTLLRCEDLLQILTCAAFNADESKVVVGANGGLLYIWDISTIK